MHVDMVCVQDEVHIVKVEVAIVSPHKISEWVNYIYEILHYISVVV